MARIGIIGAMDAEINLLREQMTDIVEKKIGKITFYEGRLQNKDVVLFRCGIGKVNAAVGANVAIREFQVEKLIFTGIAGAISSHLNILDIVISSKLVQHDFDLVGFGCPLGLIDGEDSVYFDADEELIKISEAAAKKVLGEGRSYTGVIATGDQFVADREKVQKIGEIFNAMATEMEGAAVAQVAHMYKTPFVVLRAMSDKADGSAHMTYEEFKPAAADQSAKIVMEILGNL